MSRLLNLCHDMALPRCLGQPGLDLPPAPTGYTWVRLEGRFSFSAYAHPSENTFMGDLVDIPGIQGLKAKDGFLYGVDGIGMQGGGYIWRLNNNRKLKPIYIRYIAGEWKLGDQKVVVSDQWRYGDTGSSVDPASIENIRLADARFAIDTPPNLTPYSSVAASPRFPLGTKLFVPGLLQYGGLFEVKDYGGAFGPDSQRFDVYVGEEMSAALNFIRIGSARMNLVVYQLEPAA